MFQNRKLRLKSLGERERHFYHNLLMTNAEVSFGTDQTYTSLSTIALYRSFLVPTTVEVPCPVVKRMQGLMPLAPP